jgi:hypothetical protein
MFCLPPGTAAQVKECLIDNDVEVISNGPQSGNFKGQLDMGFA